MVNEMEFYQIIVPAEAVKQHARDGGKRLSAQAADLQSGEQLRVMSGYEPYFPGSGDLGLHISISVGIYPHPGPSRFVTDAEVEIVRALWPDKDLIEESDPINKQVRHLWERG